MTSRSQRTAAPAAPDATGQTGHRLRGETLGRFDSTVMAVAGSAPAYSIAGTTATLVGAVGFAGPAALLYCGIPMLGIAFAFSYLTRVDVNAGASYSWVARALHPALGFIAGWALVVSALIFMVIGSLPAGTATLSLFSASAAANTTDTLIVGAIWFLVMLALVGVGVRITAHAQWIMTGVEVAILLAFGLGRARPQRPRGALQLALVQPRRLRRHERIRGRRAGRRVLLLGLGRHLQPERGDEAGLAHDRLQRLDRRAGHALPVRDAVDINMNLTSDQISGNAANVLPCSAAPSGPGPAARSWWSR